MEAVYRQHYLTVHVIRPRLSCLDGFEAPEFAVSHLDQLAKSFNAVRIVIGSASRGGSSRGEHQKKLLLGRVGETTLLMVGLP